MPRRLFELIFLVDITGVGSTAMRILRPFVRVTTQLIIEDWEATLFSKLAPAKILKNFAHVYDADAIIKATQHRRIDVFMFLFDQQFPIPKQRGFLTYRECMIMREGIERDGFIDECLNVAIQNNDMSMMRLLGPLTNDILHWFPPAIFCGTVRLAMLIFKWGRGYSYRTGHPIIHEANNNAALALSLPKIKLLDRYGKLDGYTAFEITLRGLRHQPRQLKSPEEWRKARSIIKYLITEKRIVLNEIFVIPVFDACDHIIIKILLPMIEESGNIPRGMQAAARLGKISALKILLRAPSSYIFIHSAINEALRFNKVKTAQFLRNSGGVK